MRCINEEKLCINQSILVGMHCSLLILCCYIKKTCPCNILCFSYAPVICIPGSPGAGDSGDMAGLKCQALTSDVSRQCGGFAGVMISRQYTVTLIQIR